MGVYSTIELRGLNVNAWRKMYGIHKSDLEMYHKSEDYPTRERDIEETLENLRILSNLINEHVQVANERY